MMSEAFRLGVALLLFDTVSLEVVGHRVVVDGLCAGTTKRAFGRIMSRATSSSELSSG